MYADLWVEITNKFLRHYAGHFVRGKEDNFKKFLDGILLDMGGLQAGGGVRSGSAVHMWEEEEVGETEHIVTFGNAFTKTLAAVDKTNLWGHGGITPFVRRKNAVPVELAASAYVSIDGLALDKGWFDLLKLGDDRSAWYRGAALTKDGWKKEPPGKPDISHILALKATKNDEWRRKWIMAFSYDHVELSALDNAITVPFIKEQIKVMNDAGVKGEAGKLLKSDLLKLLCEMREQYQALAPHLVDKEPPSVDIEIQEEGPGGDEETRAVMQHPLVRGF